MPYVTFETTEEEYIQGGRLRPIVSINLEESGYTLEKEDIDGKTQYNLIKDDI